MAVPQRLANPNMADKQVKAGFDALVGMGVVVGILFTLYLYLPVVTITFLVISGPFLINWARNLLRKANQPPERVLFVLSSHDQGYDSTEARAAADVFDAVHKQVVWASLQGGPCKAVNAPLGFSGVEGDETTLPLARCPAKDFVALYCCGGPGAMLEFGNSLLLERVRDLLQAGGAVGTCGTGLVALAAYIKEGNQNAVLQLTEKEYDKETRSRVEASAARVFSGEDYESAAVVAQAMLTALARPRVAPAS